MNCTPAARRPRATGRWVEKSSLHNSRYH